MFESAAVGSKLVVKGRRSDRDTQMLVDTGSAVTLVKETVWKETCPGNLQPVFHSVVVANGEKLEVLGQGEMKVSLGGLNEYHRVLVVKRLTQECLIAADLLTQYGCIVDFQRQIVIAGGKNIAFSREREETSSICYITVSETVEIPALCQMVVPASCSANSWCGSDQKDGNECWQGV